MTATREIMTLTGIMKPVLSILSHVIQQRPLIRAERATMLQDTDLFGNYEMTLGYNSYMQGEQRAWQSYVF